MKEGPAEDASPVDAALARAEAAISDLIDAVDAGGLDDRDPDGFGRFLQRFETFRNRLSLVDHRLVADAENRHIAQHYSHSRLTSWLVSALRLSPGEASQRVKASEALRDRVSMVGEVLPPLRPVLAAAQRAGQVSPEQVAVVTRALDAIDRRGIDPAEVASAERLLVEHAAVFHPRELHKIAVHVTDAIDPDGSLPDDQLIADRRDFRLSALRDGSYRCEGRLTPSLAALLKTVCTPLSKPRGSEVDGPQGGTIELPDPRHHGQRMHDALEEALTRLLRVGDLPTSGGVPTTLLVTIGYEDLLAKTGHGESADGTLLPVREVLRLADEAAILPAVLTRSGALLELGRTHRFASHNQTMALVARDGGCSFPGCDQPPSHCDRHHIAGWLQGGATDIDNLTLLCRYHHTHFVGHGWTCRLNRDGVIEWIPPRWIDPHQRPLINTRIIRRRDQRARTRTAETVGRTHQTDDPLDPFDDGFFGALVSLGTDDPWDEFEDDVRWESPPGATFQDDLVSV